MGWIASEDAMTEFNHLHAKAIAEIHKRAERVAGHRIDRMSLAMDMAAANGVNGNMPLDVGRLLSSDDFNFAHDVFGIMRHMNRNTGELEGFFVPRFASATAAA